MTTLILNVDRDNDFGEKANFNGPVVGLENCHIAAEKLMEVDPEDSDANALFGAIKHYRDLKKEDEDVEIALVTGDKNVGEVSDRKLGKQLEQLLSGNKYSGVILVTDGAEDDYIVPLIVSFKKIEYVKHIIVRHNQNIESLYYYIVRAIQDKRLVNKFIIPIGLILLAYGVVSVVLLSYNWVTAKITYLDPSIAALTVVTIVIGAYLLEKGFEIGKSTQQMVGRMWDYASETRILFLSYIIAIGLIFVGIAYSYASARAIVNSPFNSVLVFLSVFTWWVLASIFVREVGLSLELYTNGEHGGVSKSLFGVTFSASIAFIVYGIISYIRFLLLFTSFTTGILSVFYIVLGVIIAILSALVHRYFNEKGVSSSNVKVESNTPDGPADNK
ncbi:MAG: DUF373 family protein [Thermoplasmatales archaeon]|nr:DUF373 family protein [Thermoplasmatales archaeon]MCW6169985.1 DUF373 family protein [Thermoplasmatales archaeon]